MFSIMARPAAVAINLFGTLKLAWARSWVAVRTTQPAFFCRAFSRLAGFCRASLLFFPGIGSSISPCPLMRLRGFFGEAEAAFSWAMLWRSASMILRTFCGPRHGALARDHDARLLLLEHFNDGFLVMVDEP